MKTSFLVQSGLLLALVAYAASSSGATDTAAVKEIGKKTSGGLEITLVSAPPRTQEETKKMMEQMGQTGMKEMMKEKGMGDTMEMPSEPATHWLGVIVLNSKTQRFVPNLKVTIMATGPVTRNVELMSMPGSYAQNISLPSGRYDIIVRIDFPKDQKKPIETRFKMKA